ncbi:MAG: CRISPR-associated protein Csx14 [Methanoculleaceae archaeon]
MKTAVIGPLGLSPPVISTFVEGIGEPVSDVVLLMTRHPMVIAGSRFLRAGLKRRYPWIRVHEELLDFDDISSNQENFTFMSVAARQIRRERETFQCDKIYLNCAGGRKNECVTLAVLGQILQVDGIYHIINENVGMLNERLERYRNDIKEFRDLNEEECDRRYEDNVEEYESLLFPNPSTYELIRIPTLPYPEDYLGYLIIYIKNHGEGMEKSDIDLLVRHGILDKIGTQYDITPHGENFLRVLMGR